MKYKLFDEYITLQALLKEVGIIQSGGAIKAFLAASISYASVELIDEPVLIKPIAIVSLIELNI